MSPFLGQGAVMAIEDGVVLGRCIGIADSFGEAFARYEQARQEGANGVQLASRRRARALQGTDPAGPSSGTDAQGLGPIGRAHACTPTPNAHLVTRLLLE